MSSIFVWLCVNWFKLKGWRIPRVVPVDLKQYVLVVAPHTSNVDFPIGIAARKIMNLNVKYVAKKELFKFPVRNTLLKLGGYPVDRSKKSSFVEKVAALFDKHVDFAVCITPEGTRSRVTTWKTGFYHIAVMAGVPIVLVGFDYDLRVVVVSEPLRPSGDIEADMNKMHAFFSRIVPKHKERSQYFDV